MEGEEAQQCIDNISTIGDIAVTHSFVYFTPIYVCTYEIWINISEQIYIYMVAYLYMYVYMYLYVLCICSTYYMLILEFW